MIKEKKAQSEVVSSVLLILIVIASIGIIMAFVIPFVKNQISGSDCLNIAGKIEIKSNSQYTCYNSTKKNMSVQIHIGDIEDEIKGFTIVLGGATSSSFEIINSSTNENVLMYNGNHDLEIPKKSEDRTYILRNVDSKPDSISVYGILKNDKLCDISDSLETISNCQS